MSAKSRRPDRIDFLPGTRIARRGRRWRADVVIGAGPWRVEAHAIASTPATAAHRAIGHAWLAVLAEWRKEQEAAP